MSDLTTIIGGTEIQTRHCDGKTQVVKVRQLPIRLLATYLACFEDEAATVELFCDQPKGWAESLTPEIHEIILEEGERLNLDFLRRYVQRAEARRAKVMPGMPTSAEIMEAAKAKMMESMGAQFGASPLISPPKPVGT